MNIYQKNRILIGGLLSDTYNFLQRTYNQSRNLFTSASAWGQILFVLQNLSQMILYFIEDSITELNIYQATRDYSVKSLARLAGYDPGRASTAQGEISIEWNLNTAPVGGGAVIIPNNTSVQCIQNGKTYSMIFSSPSVTFNLVAGNTLRVKIAQGTVQNSIVTGTGRALQSFNIPSKSGSFVDQYYVNVYVNEEKWKRYDSFYDMPLQGSTYIVKTGISSGIDVYFGNGNFGKVPPPGSRIRIEYIQTLGGQGNVRSTADKPITYRFIGLGTDLFGQQLNLNDYVNIRNQVDPLFGSDPESVELIRLVAPYTSRSFVLANPQAYEIYLTRLNMFSQIHAYSTFDDEYLDDDNIVYLYLVPDITLNLESNEDYFDIPTSEFILSPAMKLAILNLLEDSGQMIATTVLKIIDPQITRIVGNASVTIFEGNDPTTIKNTIRRSIADYMLNLKRRDRIPRSDIIAILESIPGVDSANFFFTSQKNEANQITMQGVANLNQATLSQQVGIDSFGDIIIGRNELVIMRGGWTDRYGVYYKEGIVEGQPCALNIDIPYVVPNTFNSESAKAQKSVIINSNSQTIPNRM
jgi:hypothetical protein